MRTVISFVMRKVLEQESKKSTPVCDFNLWLNLSSLAELLSGRFMAAVEKISDEDNQ